MTSAAKVPSGGPLHRRVNKPHSGGGPRVNLTRSHPAIVEGRTLFPKSVVDPRHSPRLLVSGMNQRKIGKMITKGRWKGMPLYTLTLEERATCPSSCQEWVTCYGNQMHWSRRHRVGIDLEARLIGELVDLDHKHPAGFAVRLHILGDFYSEVYVSLWRSALEELPRLHVFGFTAHLPRSAMGKAVHTLNTSFPDRCRIRFSNQDAGGFGSLVIDSMAESQRVVCPVQTGKTDCCGTCGLCWTMGRTVEFVRH